MITIIDDAKKAGDSVGGIFEVIATGLPYGLGSPMQWDRKLQAKITSMMMSVNAFKGIDIGGGMNESEKWGSEVHDEIGWENNKYIRYSNNAGGLEGGMTNAQPIVLKIAPDINDTEIQKISEVLLSNQIDALIISNSSDASRENLKDIQKHQKGGLSGKPIAVSYTHLTLPTKRIV